jgi:hypothetical protein
MRKLKRRGMIGLFLLLATLVSGCGWWGVPKSAPGPVPLGPPGKTIKRLKREKSTFETTLTEILWDDGHGAVKASDRVKTIMDAAPKQLLDRVNATRKALNFQGKPYDQLVFDARAVVVSLNPDVVIVSVAERKPSQKPGDIDDVFPVWDQLDERWQVVWKALDRGFGYWLGNFGLYAGPLAAWADEMYAFSTDPVVGFRRLNFERGQTTVPLSKGELVLRHRGMDVDVSRQ